MDITANAAELKKALRIPKAHRLKTSFPFAAARLIAVNGQVAIQAGNYDVLATARCPAEVAWPGKALIDLDTLDKLLKGKGEVRIFTEGDKATVVNGVTAKVPTIDYKEWPLPPKSLTGSPSVSLSVDHVREVMPAVSGDKARPILTAMFLHDGDLVATDSYRLHCIRGVETLEDDVLIPAEVLSQFLKAGVDGRLTVHTDHGIQRAKLVAGSHSWYFTPVEGDFPNYRQLIPESQPFRLVVERDRLVALVEEVQVLTKGDAAPVRLELTASSLTARIVSTRNDTDVSGSVPCEWNGPEFSADAPTEENGLRPGSIQFNGPFLADTLKAAREDAVAIGISDALKPAVLREGRPDGTESIRLLMPVRVR